ncbi:shikimate kinase [Paenibacillus sp. GCM10023252]|uniref:shikimate kinase n=1 Tax=Paenibacillus sp. GCM10023252 TaxID=3252649 RepID=UPI00360A3718
MNLTRNDAANGSKIVLVGFMGTGKSTVSRLLADQLGWQRVDVDEEIEQLQGESVRELFASKGEAEFRRIESAALAGILAAPEQAVIATGGGAVLREDNRERMLQSGFVVALTCDSEQIMTRVQADQSRPLLQGDPKGNVIRLLQERKDAYQFAHYTVDTTLLSAEEVVHAIRREHEKLVE